MEGDTHNLQQQYNSLNAKIERLEERYIEEEITAELYHKFSSKYKEEKREIEKKLLDATKQVSNLEECVEMTMGFASEMATRWHSADYSTKQDIQFLLFPQGISYDKKSDRCRTSRINIPLAYLAYFKQVILNDKRGIPD